MKYLAKILPARFRREDDTGAKSAKSAKSARSARSAKGTATRRRTTTVPEVEAPAKDPALPIGPADAILAGVVVALVAFGVVMVYSASAVYASQRYGDGQHFLIRQGVFAVVGIFVVLAVARIDYHRYRAFTYPILAAAGGLLTVTALGFGHSAGGAARWIQLGPVNIQPAEMAKLALILWLALSLSKKADKIRTFSVGFLPHALVAGTLMLLCLKQPDFGSAVMMGLLTFVLLFAAGAKTGYLLGAVLLAAPAAYALIATSPYRMRRIQAFLEPFEHRYDVGYQISESLMSFGSGGAFGLGIGDSRQKLFFLPEAHTDFISAIIGEELGFVGIVVLISAFVLLVLRGMRAAFQAADDYGTYLAVGVTMFIGLQAFTNLAVAMGMLPTKGLALPFISYGGSSLLVNCAAIGVLLNVSRPRPLPEGDGDEGDEGERESFRRARASARRSGPGRHGRALEGAT
ncbi:MAG: putative lipid II flippase FtsW [Deltaproteobacteria bacterium]|nr:putative lipid II flippase FtsW [Deltaproteobacteria bacterium]